MLVLVELHTPILYHSPVRERRRSSLFNQKCVVVGEPNASDRMGARHLYHKRSYSNQSFDSRACELNAFLMRWNWV